MKRTSRVVSNQHFNLARFFAMGTSAVSLLAGMFFVFANPQFSNKDRDLAIYEGGVGKELVSLEPDKRSRNIGLLLLVFGLVSGALGVALSGEDEMDHPTTVKALAPAMPFPSKNDPPITSERAELVVDNLQNKLETLPWLASCIAAPSVIIVGGTGSGKSRFAMCLGLFQCLIQNGTLRIGDLDAYQNLERGAWIAGSVYGEKPANAPVLPEITQEQVQHLKDLIGIAYGGTRSESSSWETYIWDELIKWQGDPYLAEQLQALMGYGVATTRKRNQGFIYLAHGLEKGMFGGETNASGILSSLLEVSPVIYLPVRKTAWGRALKEDYFFYKAAGKRLGKVEEPPTKANHKGWELLSFPRELDPSKVGEILRPTFEIKGLKLETSSDRAGVVNTEKRAEFRKEMHETFPMFQGLIDEMKAIDKVESLNKMLDLEFVPESVDVSKLPDLALKLYRASGGKYSKGEHNINNVFLNWRKTGGFTGKGAKQNFIAFLKETPGIQVTESTFQFKITE
jgi:hypothetical protein